jgi:hypothetical protein
LLWTREIYGSSLPISTGKHPKTGDWRGFFGLTGVVEGFK